MRLAVKRGAGDRPAATMSVKQTLNQLLTEMDALRRNSRGVIYGLRPNQTVQTCPRHVAYPETPAGPLLNRQISLLDLPPDRRGRRNRPNPLPPVPAEPLCLVTAVSLGRPGLPHALGFLPKELIFCPTLLNEKRQLLTARRHETAFDDPAPQ